MSYEKHYFLALVGLSHSLDIPDRVFSLFSTSERQLALTEMPRTRDLTILALTMTITMTMTTEPLRACALGNNSKIV